MNSADDIAMQAEDEGLACGSTTDAKLDFGLGGNCAERSMIDDQATRLQPLEQNPIQSDAGCASGSANNWFGHRKSSDGEPSTASLGVSKASGCSAATQLDVAAPICMVDDLDFDAGMEDSQHLQLDIFKAVPAATSSDFSAPSDRLGMCLRGKADRRSGASSEHEMTDDHKRLKRRVANRESAQRVRQKRRAQLEDLQMKVAKMTGDTERLKQQVSAAEAARDAAAEQLASLKVRLEAEKAAKLELEADIAQGSWQVSQSQWPSFSSAQLQQQMHAPLGAQQAGAWLGSRYSGAGAGFNGVVSGFGGVVSSGAPGMAGGWNLASTTFTGYGFQSQHLAARSVGAASYPTVQNTASFTAPLLHVNSQQHFCRIVSSGAPGPTQAVSSASGHNEVLSTTSEASHSTAVTQLQQDAPPSASPFAAFSSMPFE